MGYLNASSLIRKISSDTAGVIPTRKLGKTGLSVSCIGLGGESLLSVGKRGPDHDPMQEAVDLVLSAFQQGINYFDTAPGYYPSEIRLGEALKGAPRDDFILASKTDKRDRDGALRQLEQSLKNLNTDHLNIWQLHHIDNKKDVDQIFKDDGAIQALQEAKEQGMVRYLGVTGHYDPEPLNDCLNKFDFDTILMVTNAADVHKDSMIKKVLPNARKKEMGIIGMKVCSRGRLFDPRHINSMEDALGYALSLPISTVIVGHDNIDQLIQNIAIAKTFQKFSDSYMKQLEEMTKEYANLALFFRKGFEKFNPFW